jgi:hypothetical protein
VSESPFASAEIRRLARELADVRRELSIVRGSVTTSSFGVSSLDGGTLIIKDGSGLPRTVIGTQGDGTVTTIDVNAPAPPQPADPVVTPVPGGFTVSWSGAFVNGVARPADFAWVEVHIDLNPAFEVSDATTDFGMTVRGTKPVNTGDDYVPHTVRLVARNTSGVRSVPSGAVTVTPLQLGPGDIAPGGVGTINLEDGAVSPPKSGTGVTSNLVPDPGFNNSGWRAKRTVAPWGFVEATSVGFTTGDWTAFCPATTARAALSGTGPGGIPVIPGEVYYIAYDAARSAAGAGKFFLEVTFWNSTGILIPATTEEGLDPLLEEVRDISSLPTSTFEVRHGQVTIPPLVSLMRVAIVRQDEVGTSSGNLFLDRLEVRPVITQTGSGSRVETSPSGVIVFGADGAAVGSINRDGSLSMVSGQFDQSVTYQGTELGDLLSLRARGEVARVDAGFSASPSTSTEVEWLEFEFTAYSGRSYKLRSSGLIARGTGQRGLRVRWTTNGTRPLLSSPVFADNDVSLNQTLYLASDLGWSDGIDREVKMLFSIKVWSGTSLYFDPSDVATGFSVWVEDVGPRQPSSGGVVTPIGTPIGGGGTAPAPTPVVQTFTKTYSATWSQSWVAGNQRRSDDDNQMWQGYISAASGYGDQVGIFGFNYSTIQADLTGATIKKLEVFLYAEHWYYGTGGTVRLGTTPAGTPPSSFPAVSTQRAFWSLAKPEGRWVTLNAGVTIGNELKSGATRSFALDPRPYNRELTYYGRFSGAGTAAGRNPAIRITYEKAV